MAVLTLVWSLVQCLLLAFLGILLPLRKKNSLIHSGGFACLAYFSALGLGFMFLEITLVQKLMVFLGGPTLTMALTFFSVLFFSGLGSLFARRWNDGVRRIFPLLGVAVTGLILV